MKISIAILKILKIQKIRTLEECAENYVDLVKGYAETIQELFPTFEDVLSEKMRLKLRDRREITVELTPELIKGEFDYEMYRNILNERKKPLTNNFCNKDNTTGQLYS